MTEITAKQITSTEFPWVEFTGIIQSYVCNPTHGGKVTCHKCNGFIFECDAVPYLDHQHLNEFPKAHFHKDCYNPYEHYYGLDKPLD